MKKYFLLFLLYVGIVVSIDTFSYFGMSQQQVIKYKTIVTWDNLLSVFEKNLTAIFDGIEATAILCPKKSQCPSINTTCQPPSIQKVGGVCGIDFTTVPFNGKVANMYLLPRIVDSLTKNFEMARGIVVTSTGIVFDLAGGGKGCITKHPEVGTEIIVRKQDVYKSAPVVVAGIHCHSPTYFHTGNSTNSVLANSNEVLSWYSLNSI